MEGLRTRVQFPPPPPTHCFMQYHENSKTLYRRQSVRGFLFQGVSHGNTTAHRFVGIFVGITNFHSCRYQQMKYNLTDAAIRNAKPLPDGKPQRYTDGGGMYLLVTNAGKYWRYNYRMDGKQKTLALGVYPDVSLKLARERHQEARELLARGVDPSSYKQAVKAEQEALHKNSFEAVAREWFVKFKHQWVASHADKVIRRLERDIFPWLGKQPIATIEPPDILECLRRIEERGALETAHRAKQNIGQVFRYAVATGRVKRDQTTDLKGALPPPKKSNFAAITDPKEIGGLLRAMDDGGVRNPYSLKAIGLPVHPTQ